MSILKNTFILSFVFFVLTSLAKAQEPPKLIPLRAGPVTAVFDADNVFLRYIRVGSHEVLRGINAPIRDKGWATIAPKVTNLDVDKKADSFKVTFDVACQNADIDFRWKGSISGSDKGVIEFSFDGESHSTFKRNRIGFCLLHGPSAAGQPWTLETVDGKTTKGQFPKFISAHQPAKNLRAITHEVAANIQARVDFEGEVFEMEDQRNWTDASFKTYCTPLEIPYPVEIPKGTKISQKIKISLEGTVPSLADSQTNRTTLTLSKNESALPLLGVQVSGEVATLTDEQVKRLKALHLNHLQVDLMLSDGSFVSKLRTAAQQAKALDVSLQVVLGLGESPDFDKLVKEINQLRPSVSYWLVRGGVPEHFQMARKQLGSVLGNAKIGVTQVTNFVDLNRARPEDKSIQAIGFAVNPQIHAFDNASVVETLPIQADAVNSTREFARDLPLIIGPITMAPQLLDGVDQPGGPPEGGLLPTYVDKRQVEPFAAAWTLGSLKYLADAKTHSATYFETVGWNGIMDADNVAARPKAFPSRPGEVFPVYQLLHELAEFAGAKTQQIDSSDELAAVGIALRKAGRMRVLVANLTGSTQTVSLQGLGGKSVAIQLLGAKENRVSPADSIELPPYGVARIDKVDN
jgi:D-apionolactonase